MVSFKCITYGRVKMLEEAIYSFLCLYNNDAELVIVNDYPLQTLHFDHPQIRIFNLKKTFETIGEKENFAIEQCKGDIIAVFDDDDICMPWHLNNIKLFWQADADLLHWKNGVFYNENEPLKLGWLGNSGIVYSKLAWEQIGKSPIMNAGGDTILVQKLSANGKVIYADPPNEAVSWFYRWSLPQHGGVYHQSGQGFDTPDKPNIVVRNAAHVEGLRRKGIIPTGDIELNPHWDKDYKQLLKDYNDASRN